MNKIHQLGLFLLTFSLTTCQNTADLKQEIKAEFLKEADANILKTTQYFESFFDETQILEKGEARTVFLNFFVERMRLKVDQELDNLILFSGLSNGEMKRLLACLKRFENEDLSDDCLDRIGVIMVPFANHFSKLGEASYLESFEHLIAQPNLIKRAVEAEDCLSFRTGRFHLTNPDPKHDTLKIIRTDDKQMEILGADTTTFKVEWVNDCTYQLIPLNNSDTTATYEILNKVESGYRYVSRRYVNDRLIASEISVVN